MPTEKRTTACLTVGACSEKVYVHSVSDAVSVTYGLSARLETTGDYTGTATVSTHSSLGFRSDR